MIHGYHIIFRLLFFIATHSANGQDYLIVKNIILNGNNHTKDYIVLNVLDFGIGDTLVIKGLQERFEYNEKRILSTSMFTEATIKSEDNGVINVDLREYWYIYPAPIFELADRNFNVWWNEQHRSFSRVNYGVRLHHINFSGHKDELKVVAQFGYTRKFEMAYSFPLIDKERRFGFFSKIYYADRKEIGYITEGNKTLFFKHDDERILLSRFRINAALNHRINVFFNQNIDLSYHRNSIDEHVATRLNPDYFLNGERQLQFFQLSYRIHRDKRDFPLFPREGNYILFEAKNQGFGILGSFHKLFTTFRMDQHGKYDRFSYSSSNRFRWTINRAQVPFANNTGLGYGDDFIRGYELYVMDGTDYFLSRNDIHFQVFKTNYQFDFIPLDQFSYLPVEIFLGFHVDIGYVHERDYTLTNELNNQWNYGFGPSLNVILYNNFLLNIDYNWNAEGEHGLFIQQRFSF